MVAFWPSLPEGGSCSPSASATMARNRTRTLEQNLLDVYHPPIVVEHVDEVDLTDELLNGYFANSSEPRSIGMSATYTQKGKIAVLAIALARRVILVVFRATTSEPVSVARSLLQERILVNEENNLYAFDIAPIALALFADRGLRLANGIDFQSVQGSRPDRDPVAAVKFIVTSSNTRYNAKNIQSIFKVEDTIWDASNRQCETLLALRAWVASYLPTSNGFAEDKFREVKRIDTTLRSELDLQVLARQARGEQRLEVQNVSSTRHDFVSTRIIDGNGRKARVTLSDFQTRILKPRPGSRLRIMVRTDRGEEYELHGRILDLSGKKAVIKLQPPHSFFGKTILSLISEDQDGPTAAELARAAKVLGILQGGLSLQSNPFLHTLWPTPDQEIEWPSNYTLIPPSPILLPPGRVINDSQEEAIRDMLEQSNDKRITIIQGPPGTGKTTVIATYVLSATAAGQGGIWLVAQSNVAVRNIAEKLASVEFTNWKLLVSKDFQEDWHDHLYYGMSSNVIRSDQFKDSRDKLQGCQVILCTLSMLANLRLSTITSIVPIISLVVDEASQINVSQYIYPLNHFPTIRKLCFIGDDKQLPPYGQGEVEEIESIFEMSHLREKAIFLDIQYRMPSQIGNFISDSVYEGQLRSNPGHPLANDLCAFFVDVPGSVEQPHGTSYKNLHEITTIVKMARKLQEPDNTDSFKIITPYEAQKTQLEKALKDAGLTWQNKCFAVDSFQGNEEDIIILSLVRTKALGFLEDLRRTNVMLTRCKKYMFVVSSWDFLVNSFGSLSLAGKMAAYLGQDSWIWQDDIDSGNW